MLSETVLYYVVCSMLDTLEKRDGACQGAFHLSTIVFETERWVFGPHSSSQFNNEQR